jgi:hypothetical protein
MSQEPHPDTLPILPPFSTNKEELISTSLSLSDVKDIRYNPVGPTAEEMKESVLELERKRHRLLHKVESSPLDDENRVTLGITSFF